MRMSLGRASGVVESDWTFELAGWAGLLLFRIGSLPQGWMLQSVLLNGRDITDEPLAVKGTEEITDLEIRVTNRTTEIGGTVTDADGKPVQEYTVVAFAEEAARWTYPSRFIRTARPDQASAFRISNLPPAEYLVVALDYLEEGESDDPEFLESIRSKAAKLELGDGDKRTLTLKLARLEGQPD